MFLLLTYPSYTSRYIYSESVPLLCIHAGNPAVQSVIDYLKTSLLAAMWVPWKMHT